jgi:flagellar biosynthesis GTPase FlhF
MQKILIRQLRHMNKDNLFWGVPLVMTAAWLLYPTLDQNWLVEVGWAADPEATINRVEEEKQKRLQAFKLAKGIPASGTKTTKKEKVEEEEEEEEEEQGEEEESTEEETSEEEEEEESPKETSEEEDVPAMEDGDEDAEEEGEDEKEAEEEEEEEEEEEDDDDEKEPVPGGPFLYDPVKGDNLTYEEIFDNFTIKSLHMTDDDDDDDDDEDEGTFSSI